MEFYNVFVYQRMAVIELQFLCSTKNFLCVAKSLCFLKLALGRASEDEPKAKRI